MEDSDSEKEGPNLNQKEEGNATTQKIFIFRKIKEI